MVLPAITMVFCIVDGGKGFSARFRRDARRVHDVCAACIRACLRCVPGGYLCRLQVGGWGGGGVGVGWVCGWVGCGWVGGCGGVGVW